MSYPQFGYPYSSAPQVRLFAYQRCLIEFQSLSMPSVRDKGGSDPLPARSSGKAYAHPTAFQDAQVLCRAPVLKWDETRGIWGVWG